MTVRIVLDPSACTGHGRCYSVAPTLFDCDESGHAVVLSNTVSGDDERLAELARANCPEAAITLEP